MSADDELRLFDDAGNAGRFHPGDPWTSKAAARTVTAGTGRYRVLTVFGTSLAGRTDYEVAVELELLAHVVGTRRGELVEAGYVEPTDARRPTDTGALARVHRITPAGRDALRQADEADHERRNAVRAAPQGTKARGRPQPAPPSLLGLTAPKDRILEELARRGPLTDIELGVAIGQLRTAAGTYRRQLEDAGLVEPTGYTGLTPSGRHARTHRITDIGRRHLNAITRPQ